MVNVPYLEEVIDKSGLKKEKIAESLGITTQTLRNKLDSDNSSTFDCDEAYELCRVLKIPAKERGKIFFAQNVEKGGQNG